MKKEIAKESIVAFLKIEFKRRKELNPSYSLRAFARDLDLSPSSLSRVLNQKREITDFIKRKVISKFKLNSNFLEHELEYQLLEIDNYQLNSSWYYDAILECIKFADFKATPLWISRKLEISIDLAQEALDALKDKKLLQKINGQWVDNTSGHTSHISSEYMTSEARKNYQQGLLRRSEKALLETPINMRDHTGMMVSIKKENLPKAKKLLKSFRRKFAQLMDEDQDADSVYELCLNFFPLTSNDSKGKNEIYNN